MELPAAFLKTRLYNSYYLKLYRLVILLGGTKASIKEYNRLYYYIYKLLNIIFGIINNSSESLFFRYIKIDKEFP